MPRSWTWIIPKHSAWCRTPCAGAWGPGEIWGKTMDKTKNWRFEWENDGKMIYNDIFHAMFDYCGVDIPILVKSQNLSHLEKKLHERRKENNLRWYFKNGKNMGKSLDFIYKTFNIHEHSTSYVKIVKPRSCCSSDKPEQYDDEAQTDSRCDSLGKGLLQMCIVCCATRIHKVPFVWDTLVRMVFISSMFSIFSKRATRNPKSFTACWGSVARKPPFGGRSFRKHASQPWQGEIPWVSQLAVASHVWPGLAWSKSKCPDRWQKKPQVSIQTFLKNWEYPQMIQNCQLNVQNDDKPSNQIWGHPIFVHICVNKPFDDCLLVAQVGWQGLNTCCGTWCEPKVDSVSNL